MPGETQALMYFVFVVFLEIDLWHTKELGFCVQTFLDWHFAAQLFLTSGDFLNLMNLRAKSAERFLCDDVSEMLSTQGTLNDSLLAQEPTWECPVHLFKLSVSACASSISWVVVEMWSENRAVIFKVLNYLFERKGEVGAEREGGREVLKPGIPSRAWWQGPNDSSYHLLPPGWPWAGIWGQERARAITQVLGYSPMSSQLCQMPIPWHSF